MNPLVSPRTPYNGLYVAKGVHFSGFRYIKMVRISQVEVYNRVGKSVIWLKYFE